MDHYYMLISNIDMDMGMSDIQMFNYINERVGFDALVKIMWLRNPDGQKLDQVLACFKDLGDASVVQVLLGHKMGKTIWRAEVTSRTFEKVRKEQLYIDSIRYGRIF